jgi:hypothetical protein
MSKSNIINEIKKILFGENYEAKLKEIKSGDITISFDGETVEEGMMIKGIDAEGNEILLDGEYELEDGVKILVKENVVEKILSEEEKTEEGTEEGKTEEGTEEGKTEEGTEEGTEEEKTDNELETRVVELETRVAELEKLLLETNKQSEVFKNEVFEKLKTTPKETKKFDFRSLEDKGMVDSELQKLMNIRKNIKK